MIYLLTAVFALISTLMALTLWRQLDHQADRRAMKNLLTTAESQITTFDPAMIEDLPEPAKRYFQYTIAPGTPLKRIAQIEMQGQFGMGDQNTPRYKSMVAKQILALPNGFIWKMSTRLGLLTMSGSDTEQWTRFWLAGFIPLAREGGNEDHSRSAFGRYAAESLFWTPAALLPSPTVNWIEEDANTARVRIRNGVLEQEVCVSVDAEGKPVEVYFQRWSNANSARKFRWQPFGGYLSEFREFDGYKLPTHVEAGNHFGTPEYFPFFVIDVSSIHFTGGTSE